MFGIYRGATISSGFVGRQANTNSLVKGHRIKDRHNEAVDHDGGLPDNRVFRLCPPVLGRTDDTADRQPNRRFTAHQGNNAS